MIIEIIGSSGSGKSTLLRCLQVALSLQDLRVCRVGHNADSQHPLINSYITNIDKHSILTDLLLLPWIFRAFLSLPTRLFVYVTVFILKCNSHRVAIFRAVYRKIAIFTLLRSRSDGSTIFLVDEGIMHSMNNIFIPYKSTLPEERLEKYLRYLPSPDLIVLLESPIELLYERLINRGDWSPRVRNEQELLEFIKQSHTLFAYIASFLNGRKSVLTLSSLRREPESLSQAVVDYLKLI